MSVNVKDSTGNNLTSTEGALNVFVQGETSSSTLLGVYNVQSTPIVIAATAHSADTGGFLWITNPTGSGRVVRITRIKVTSNIGSALATPTSPRLSLSQMSFSGTPSGSQLIPAKLDSTYPATILDIRSAITGLSCVYGSPIFNTFPIAAATAVGVATPALDIIYPRIGEHAHMLREGEGLVFWQQDNGTTSDTRRVLFGMQWEEITIP